MKKIIPFSPPYITEDDITEVVHVLRSGWITTGKVCEEFSLQLSSYNQSSFTQLFNSATAGLFIALKAMGIGPGDEVITTPYTFAASANVILHTGARLVFADVKKDSFFIDPEEVYAKITPNTKAIIPVDFSTSHQYQWDHDRLSKHFTPNNKYQAILGRPLILIDAAHSLGSRFLDSSIDMAVYSFHAVKNLTTAEGGALSINSFGDDRLDHEFQLLLRSLLLHGQNKSARDKFLGNQWEYDITCAGYKYNMTDIAAALGLSQLQRYQKTLQQRRLLFKKYQEYLSGNDQFIMDDPVIFDHVDQSSCHLFPLRINQFSEDQRNKLIDYCFAQGVSVNVHYKPLHLMSCSDYHEQNVFPNAVAQYQNEISLPLHLGMTQSDIEYVVSILNQGYLREHCY
ncbi:MAG: DegT/DnrJ/EryC1/StrS family aminotransferase [Brevinema sp.]